MKKILMFLLLLNKNFAIISQSRTKKPKETFTNRASMFRRCEYEVEKVMRDSKKAMYVHDVDRVEYFIEKLALVYGNKVMIAVLEKKISEK